MAEDGPQPEAETGSLQPEGSGQVPLSSSGGPTCALRILCTPVEGPVVKGVEGMEGEWYSVGWEFWWLLGSESCWTPSSSSGTPEVRGGSY